MNSPTRVAVLTTGRQDYGILRSTLVALREDPRFALLLWAGGMHLVPEFGETVTLIENDGFMPARRLPFIEPARDPAAESARLLAMVALAIREDAPDMLVLVGDRTETLAAGVAAAMELVPLVHIHGGEETEGAVDNVCRHALTKLSHLHLVSHDIHARRVLQMGEDPASVIVVGAPGLDNQYRTDLPSIEEIALFLGHDLPEPIVLVTVHPTTLGDDAADEVRAVSSAMELVDATYVVSAPNSDLHGDTIRHYWDQWARGRDNVVVVSALGERRYWGLMLGASAVLGNSSSGLIEAPGVGVPVVNVGDRQKGRFRYGRVADVSPDRVGIAHALRGALDGSMPALADTGYPAGRAADRIVEALAAWNPPRPPRKHFNDMVCAPSN